MSGAHKHIPFETRFWSNVRKTESCWLWTACLNSFGYGMIERNGKHCRAHRASWELAGRTIPDGKCVLHSCDNPPCVNPDHLFLGDPADNTADMFRKGRQKMPPEFGPKTHCKRGHLLSPDNAPVLKTGKRYCRTCDRERKRRKAEKP